VIYDFNKKSTVEDKKKSRLYSGILVTLSQSRLM